MKKILFTLALAAFALTANAQIVIGGELGFHHDGAHDDNYTMINSNASTTLTIMPKIGYQLNDKMQVGANLGWSYTYTRNYAGADNTYTSHPESTFEFTPYLRYNLTKWKNFTVFCEALLGISIHPESSNYSYLNGSAVAGFPAKRGDNWTRFGLNVIPGLNSAITEKISMDVYVNLLGIHAWTKSGNNTSEHDLGFNADASAQSLNAQFGNFMIGFNYAL